ncbi:hypothetical protein C468_01250 [Halorubrum kocurii JCM 14978]|uniref:Uncharacterized protein n=1 Tax=Halorubrum kocurii JCM 14978 TaxID=1230456 RepID=M0PI56_9EURY|nr:hypothetical protein C468_01250 [Halorubrum kocurii JCM 14978]
MFTKLVFCEWHIDQPVNDIPQLRVCLAETITDLAVFCLGDQQQIRQHNLLVVLSCKEFRAVLV